MKYIPYGKQSIDKNDIKAVEEVLKSDWITQGTKIGDFEKAIAKYCGAKYAVAVSNGTAALHLTCVITGLKKGDEAITTPITFLATSNAVLYSGAKPVFADVNSKTANIGLEEIKSKITKKTKAILPVHFAGRPCDMPGIYKIARQNKITVIEDACHALGAEYKYKGTWYKVGSCKHSDMTVLSFHPVKHITTGEGGAITTNSRKIYERLQSLRSHGVYKSDALIKKYGSWYYEMRELGFNYRITDFQCALGITQLKKIKNLLKKRRDIARYYDRSLKGLEYVGLPKLGNSEKHAYHLYPLAIDFKKYNITKIEFVNALKKRKILTQVHYRPVYLQSYYNKLGYKRGSCPNAEEFYKKELSIPMYSSMSDNNVVYVADTLKNILKKK
ncbi:MAG: UDP-4-amino-4,6-dideoxy-N-acetyl-beta-L-altrosamine transaminase [Candidatus Omnitrophica bacterium]|nr:UDP-4-amino-4,6-dideoxy-N-acetyl-beta-L-altrosamine transaminase [Candidatus Omnitrophota bacterium]